jgi:hypothetical protein
MCLLRGILLALPLTVGLTGCGRSDAKAPPRSGGGEAQARALLGQFVKPGADCAALSKQLRPTKEDFAAVFSGDAAAKAAAGYGPPWDAGQMVIQGKPDQTEVLLWSATSDELKAGTGNAGKFPGGYKQVAQSLQPGLTLYLFKFVRPGADLGMAFDGLVFVNGHFVIFPKPWRVLK